MPLRIFLAIRILSHCIFPRSVSVMPYMFRRLYYFIVHVEKLLTYFANRLNTRVRSFFNIESIHLVLIVLSTSRFLSF